MDISQPPEYISCISNKDMTNPWPNFPFLATNRGLYVNIWNFPSVMQFNNFVQKVRECSMHVSFIMSLVDVNRQNIDQTYCLPFP